MKPRAGSIAAVALLAALVGVGACAQPTAPDPAEPGPAATERLGGIGAVADSSSASSGAHTLTARKRGIGTE